MRENKPVSNIEMHWVTAHIVDLEAQYSGEWIAVMIDKVIAHGGKLKDVVQAAHAAGFDNPYFEYIPEPGEYDDSLPMLAVNG